mgnify:CR=1 FL=1
MLDVMVILVFFLIFTAVFSKTNVLELSLPAPSSDMLPLPPQLELEVIVRNGSIEVADRSTGPLKGRHIPLPVLGAIGEDKFLPIAELDRGFIRPSYENQVIVSYMQAGLICEYIAGRFGQTALEGLLVQFKAGKDTAQAIEGG